MKTIYAVWGQGSAQTDSVMNADNADPIATRIADEHGFDSTTGDRWAVIISIPAEDESDLDADQGVVGYHMLTSREIAEVQS